MVKINIICFSFLFITAFTPVFAGNFFEDILNNSGNAQNESSEWQCPSCGHSNQADARFCANCGKEMEYSQDQVTCPECGRNFRPNYNEYVKICGNCNTRNEPNSKYCRSCGNNLGNNYLIPCPYCRHEFESGSYSRSGQNTEYCGKCRKYYSPSYRECPYCKEKREGMERNRHHREERKPEIRGHQGPAEIESFTMPTNDKFPKRYGISGYTNTREFSKVVIYAHLTNPSTLFNSIRVYYNGTWNDANIAAELREGRNEYGVYIPRGASELIISFKRGRGSQIKVTLE